MGNVTNEEDLSDLRLTVDTQEDFQVTTEIFNALYSKKRIFLLKEVLKFIVKNPQISKINAKFTRNEGYLKSLLADDKKP
jgi:spore coat polysaccharide biosynthesis protein SpsF